MVVFTQKTAAMRQLLNLTSRGYFFWTSGLIPPKKLEALNYKFIDRYQIDATSQQRYRAKLKAKCSTHFICWQEDDMTIYWWLLTTEGAGLIHELEKLNDTRKKLQRLSCTGYEVVSSPFKQGGQRRWSWRMMQSTVDEWHERFKRAIRYKQETVLEQSIYSIKRVPAFAGVRQQVFNIVKTAQQEWIRSRSDQWPYDAFKLGWIGKFKKISIAPQA